MAVKFKIVEEGRDDRSVVLADETITFGRGKNNSIKIHDESCSKVHCEIMLKDGQAFIKDLDSTNGTEVDNKMTLGCHLNYTSEIRIGKCVITMVRTGMTKLELLNHKPIKGKTRTVDFDC